MKRIVLAGLFIVPVLVIGATIQAKPKPKPKPQTTVPTKGAVQMPGDKGVVGTTYQIGNVGDELHITLDTVEVSTRYKVVEENLLSRGPDRLLILHYTVQNPQKRDMSFDYGSFKFTCVSPDDENRDCDSYAYHEERKTHLGMSLKPAQKIRALVAWQIHGTGPVTKLIVARGSNRPVIRYDLRTKTKPMVSVFSPDGISIETTAKAPFAKAFDFGAFDLNVEKVEAVTGAVGQYTPADGQQLFTVTVSFTNVLGKPHRLAWGSYEPRLTDGDGEIIEWCSDMLTMTSNQTIDRDVEPDETIRAKYVFRSVNGQVPKKLRLFNNDLQRTVNIELP